MGGISLGLKGAIRWQGSVCDGREAHAMDFHPLLAALADNYGDGSPPPVDVTTVRGLLAFCKRWPNAQVQAAELQEPCLAMASRLQAAGQATQADLRANTALGPAMAEPVAQTAESFLLLSEILRELPELARDGQVEDFLEALEDYEAERQLVLEAQAVIAQQVGGAVCLCPRCGGSGAESVCPACKLVRLYPDPKGHERPPSPPVKLSGAYYGVFRAYQDVLSGGRSLPDLLAALVPLEAHLRSVLQLRQSLRQTPQEAGALGAQAEVVLNRVDPELRRAQKGVERIRLAQESLRISDINHGWDDIFDSAVVIEGALHPLRVAEGGTPSAAAVDTVELRGE